MLIQWQMSPEGPAAVEASFHSCKAVPWHRLTDTHMIMSAGPSADTNKVQGASEVTHALSHCVLTDTPCTFRLLMT
jgi:hypothetical protein